MDTKTDIFGMHRKYSATKKLNVAYYKINKHIKLMNKQLMK